MNAEGWSGCLSCGVLKRYSLGSRPNSARILPISARSELPVIDVDVVVVMFLSFDESIS